MNVINLKPLCLLQFCHIPDLLVSFVPCTVWGCARGCLIGRAYVYGLGAGGKAGVAKAIDILKSELSVTMVLCGVNKVSEIGRQVIVGGEDGAAKKPAARKRKSQSASS